MNIHLEAAIEEAAKIDALMNAIYEIYMEDAPDRLQYLHLAACDAVSRLSEELRKLSEDKRVVDVIYAVNDVRSQ